MPPEVPRIWATGWAIVQGKRKTWSKWIKDLNVRPETIKLLEENIGKTLSDIHHSRILYDPPPRILEIKAKMGREEGGGFRMGNTCIPVADSF